MPQRSQIVFFKGPVDGKNHAYPIEQIENRLRVLAAQAPNVPVTLCITSPGGHLHSSYGFLERIMLFGPRNIHTIALDDTSSAALFLFLAGQRRFVAPHALLLLHQLHSHIDEYTKNIAGACNNRSVTPDSIQALMTEIGTEITAERALSMGLAHEILSPKDEEQLRTWRDTSEF